MTKERFMPFASGPEMPDPMVIAVCLPAEIVDRLDGAVRRRSWRTTIESYGSYFSEERRPYFLPLIQASGACIAFVDFDESAKRAVETSEYLTHAFAGKITVVALSKNANSGKILMAMRAGCSEFLDTSLEEPALSELFDRLERNWAATNHRPAQAGRLLSFLGVKGGVGTTTLAVNLGVFLARQCRKRVLLIDHQPELGHVCIYLGMDGSQCQFQEVVRNVNRLDSELLQGMVCQHSSGLHALSSPDGCGRATELDRESVTRTLEFLRSEYDFVLADCGYAFAEHNYPVIESSDHVYMISTQELSALRDLSRRIDHFISLHSPLEKLRIVLNRASDLDAVQADQIEKAMKLPISVRIPTGNGDFVRAANLGEPLSPGSKSTLTAKFARWAEAVVGAPQSIDVPRKSKQLLSLWK
jgi:pilus assembly protein CpaE